MTKDYKIELKVKNNLLYKAMVLNGIHSGSELSRATGVNPTRIGDCLNLKTSLYNSYGAMRPIWTKLSEALRVLPEDLIPQAHWHSALKSNKASVEADMGDLQYLMPDDGPEQKYITSTIKEDITKVLTMLTAREERVIRLRYGIGGGEQETLDDIGDMFGISRNRVMQIEQTALHKMKRPKISRMIRNRNE